MASSIPIEASPPPSNTTDSNKQRLSRALGAAFLSHQVEQLESRVRSLDVGEENDKPTHVLYSPNKPPAVVTSGRGGGHGRNASVSTSSGGRGERRREGSGGSGRGGRGRGRARGGGAGGPGAGAQRQRRDSFDRSLPPRPAQPSSSPRVGTDGSPTHSNSPLIRDDPKLAAAAAAEYERHRMADKIVLDASVLVHALGTVRKWASSGRREDLVVPLEALNTIDLLKKGPSILAIQARAASRFLEDQVGQNARLQIQGETAFIPFDDLPASVPVLPKDDPAVQAKLAKEDSPEWVKRVLCSAAYEATIGAGGKKSVLALLAPSADLCLGDDQTARFESRVDGHELRLWAKEMGVATLEIGKGGRAGGASGDWAPRGRGGGRSRGERGGRGRVGRGRGAVGRGSEEEKEEEPVRVIKVLARGERLDT